MNILRGTYNFCWKKLLVLGNVQNVPIVWAEFVNEKSNETNSSKIFEQKKTFESPTNLTLIIHIKRIGLEVVDLANAEQNLSIF